MTEIRIATRIPRPIGALEHAMPEASAMRAPNEGRTSDLGSCSARPASPTTVLRIATALLALAASGGGGAHAISPGAPRGPVTVSPGSADSIEEIAHACPTFLWGAQPADAATAALELAVYELPAPGDRPGEERAQDAIETLEPVLFVRLPASAPGWTPPLDRCLSEGGEYAWAVRAVTDDEHDAGPWSTVRVFRVARRSGIEHGERRAAQKHAPRSTIQPPTITDEHSRRAADARRPIPAHRRSPIDRTTRLVATTAAPDPQTAPRSLSLSQSLALGASSAILKDGEILLWDDDTNLALGRSALSANSTGTRNTALGAGALIAQTTGVLNTAIGYRALAASAAGFGNVVVGSNALLSIDASTYASSYNTAIGLEALRDTTSGRNNIAIGNRAGLNVSQGDNNILIGNAGGFFYSDPLDNTIRIGSGFVHQTAFIAGDLGLGTYAPANRLHVFDSSSASSLEGHVAQIENSSTGASADVLALKIGRTDAPGAANNFVTFYDGNDAILGQCEGNGAGGVVCTSSGADYAELLPRLDPSETLAPGDVVGLFGNAVSRRTAGAQKVMVISTAPLMLGNDPGEERRGDHAPVAFVGQAPVRVRGPARAGDLLLASGLEDGTAVAEPVAEVDPGRLSRVVGRALADHPGDGEASVRALVGLPDTALLEALLERHERRLDRLERALALSASDSTSP